MAVCSTESALILLKLRAKTKTYLPISFRRPGIFGIGKTGNASAVFCLCDKLVQRHMCTPSCSVRFAWKILCRTRRSAGRNGSRWLCPRRLGTALRSRLLCRSGRIPYPLQASKLPARPQCLLETDTKGPSWHIRTIVVLGCTDRRHLEGRIAGTFLKALRRSQILQVQDSNRRGTCWGT